MEIVKIRQKDIDGRALARSVRILKAGGILVYPTETAYALGCDAMNQRACVKIFSIKGRSKSKRLPWVAGGEAMVRRLCRVGALEAGLMKKYWPGPLTLVLPLRRGRGTVAVRVPGFPFARALSKKLGRPIISTSANLSGKAAHASARAALRELQGRGIDGVLDAGRLPRRKPSTIIDARSGRVRVLRQGAVHIRDVE